MPNYGYLARPRKKRIELCYNYYINIYFRSFQVMYRFKKILALSIFAIFLIFVSGCGNSKNLLLGEWNAEKDIDVNDIVKFDNDKMTVNGKEYNFNIKSIEKKDDVIYYKIEKDGELFTVLFLFKEDRNIAYMLKPYTSDNLKEGKVIYSMHKVSNKN